MADNWESALRKLTREAPKSEVMTTVLDAMRGDLPDRPAALVMAAAADITVQGALVYALALNQAQILALFYGDGPFASFDKKIVAAFNLSVFGPTTTNNLNVRNVFAHALSDVSFTSDAIVRACNRIRLDKTSQFFVDNEEARKTRCMFGYACNSMYQGILTLLGVEIMVRGGRRKTILDHPILP
jgi:hypothetical protein